MIATITVKSHRAQAQEQRVSVTSSMAGSPLPLIPRRTSSSPSLPLPPRKNLSSSSIMTTMSTSTTDTLATTTPNVDSNLGSSHLSLEKDRSRPTTRKRRVRGLRNNTVCPPELSTPIPTTTPTFSPQFTFLAKADNYSYPSSEESSPRPTLYAPGMPLRISANSGDLSGTGISLPPEAQSAPALYESFGEPRLIRKKSGQLVKPSLKTSRSSSRSSLFVSTLAQPSKSEPTTPTNKAVHFDSKLEHVKLFLAEQKPLAVSRDGSPTDDISGTESDFPKLIFGDINDKKRLLMQVTNMPTRINFSADVALEGLTLSVDGRSILGKVLVRNIAFMKSVAVRFTFDHWQTTSEVMGKYTESISPDFDRFSFTIRLNDLLACIEGKTLIVAVRYLVEGKELWDNNGGQNYLATFTKDMVPEECLSDDYFPYDLEGLQTRLEKVARETQAQSSPRPPPYTAPAEPEAKPLRTGGLFGSRYDLEKSLKNSRSDAVFMPQHTRTQSFPVSSSPKHGIFDPYTIRLTPFSSPSHKRQPAILGSPRDFSDDMFVNLSPRPRELEDLPFTIQLPDPNKTPVNYLDVTSSTLPRSLRRVSPGLHPNFNDIGVPSPAESKSFLLPDSSKSAPSPDYFFSADTEDHSEISSMSTPSSSSESTPSSSPTQLYMSMARDDNAMSPETHYRQFLSKFCFFTGPGSTLESELIPRTHSASDIEELLSGSSPRLQNHAYISASPSHSSSVDDHLNKSGSLTPTISRLSQFSSHSQLATPTLS